MLSTIRQDGRSNRCPRGTWRQLSPFALNQPTAWTKNPTVEVCWSGRTWTTPKRGGHPRLRERGSRHPWMWLDGEPGECDCQRAQSGPTPWWSVGHHAWLLPLEQLRRRIEFDEPQPTKSQVFYHTFDPEEDSVRSRGYRPEGTAKNPLN
jgi:hypothetical protein